MIQFYAPDIESTGLLPESDSAHCCRVLRMKEGDEVVVVDGNGKRFVCTIIDAHPKRTAVEIISEESVLPHWKIGITLAVSPTKHSDRMEWMLEKAVEIGIDRVVFLRCQRSERKTINLDRLEKMMISAMKQSLKAVLPQLEDAGCFRRFVDSVPETSQKFFGYCSSEYPRKEFVRECEGGKDVVIMIGPEGDFSPEEVEYAVARGFIPVTFGESRLRTETAAVYGVAAVHILNQMENS